MADIIDFKPKQRELEVDVELEEDPQLLLEIAIVQLWHDIEGPTLFKFIGDSKLYHVMYLQFSDTCFQALESGLIEVFEDGDVIINPELLETMLETMKNFREGYETNDNLPTKH